MGFPVARVVLGVLLSMAALFLMSLESPAMSGLGAAVFVLLFSAVIYWITTWWDGNGQLDG